MHEIATNHEDHEQAISDTVCHPSMHPCFNADLLSVPRELERYQTPQKARTRPH